MTLCKNQRLPWHSVRSETKVRRTVLLLFILLSNQNWGTINFGVNFGQLIQPNSISLLHSFDWGQSGPHCSIRIRTSEDVRTSKKDKVVFYLLAQRFTRHLPQPLLLFACNHSPRKSRLPNSMKCNQFSYFFWNGAKKKNADLCRSPADGKATRETKFRFFDNSSIFWQIFVWFLVDFWQIFVVGI